MKDLPCIKNRCLKYPACKNKTHIVCDDLATYIFDLKKTENEAIDRIRRYDVLWWKEFLEEKFPKIMCVQYEEQLKFEDTNVPITMYNK